MLGSVLGAAAPDSADDVDQHTRRGGIDAFGTAADGEVGGGHWSDNLALQRVAAGVFVGADEFADLEGGRDAVELEHTGGGDANGLGVAATRSLHGDAGEFVVE